jgi:RHH-type proline utilization regulon transcriptional repressor/proline dehydrogenase/delta 1-pyrroline-5-carboxylate dehydrogenase
MPRLHVDDNPNLVSPGVKWGVQSKSFTHCTELFGPVLGVMEARDLSDAIALVNATGYGLTSGLESLDDREQELWCSQIRAGNLYINRPTTGAIVLRQPFGGMGKSSVGPGIKAGGPNYVVPLMHFKDSADDHSVFVSEDAEQLSSKAKTKPSILAAQTAGSRRPKLLQDLYRAIVERAANEPKATEDEFRRVLAAISSYERWADDEFHAAHDHFRILGEDNFRRYLPVEPLRIRIHADDSLSDIFCRAAAARAAGCRATISAPPSLFGPASASAALLDQLTDPWAGAIEFIDEDDEALAEAIRLGQIARVRYAAPDRVPDSIRATAAEALQYIADTRVSRHGRIELLWYMCEQSISHVYHRYGNLGLRIDEPRDEPA